MRHAKKRQDLNRFTSWRKATLKSIARSVILHQRIRTTKTKAQAVRPLVERLISLSKKNSLSSKRLAFKILNNHALVKILFTDIGPLFAKRNGGYTRILNLGRRRGDNAEVVLLELTEIKEKEKKKHKKEEKMDSSKKIPSISAQEKQTLPEEKQPEVKPKATEKPQEKKQPPKKFLGGIKNIFKKERDSL
jgi:large subunit ribosomal protein L17